MRNRFDLVIHLSNEVTNLDVANLLREVANKIERSQHNAEPIQDANGNSVGEWRFEEE